MRTSSRRRPYPWFALTGFMDWLAPHNPESLWHRDRAESPDRIRGFDVWCALMTSPQVFTLSSSKEREGTAKRYVWSVWG